MPDLSSEVESPEIGSNPPPPTSQETSYSFSITIEPNGFTVDGEDVADLTTLLKHVIAIVQEHANSGDALEQMSQGYESRNSPILTPAS